MPKRKPSFSANTMAKRARRGGSSFRRRKPARGKARGKFARAVKKVILSTAEPKHKDYNRGSPDFNHDVVNTWTINEKTGNVWPAQGVADNQRNGDQIMLTGFLLRMLIAQKGDRPNMNYRFIVFETSQDWSYSYGDLFENVTGNVMLDGINRDSCKVLAQKWYKPFKNPTYGQAGGDEFSFTMKMWIPRRKLIKFAQNGGYDHNDRKVNFAIIAYDTLGTIISDTIASMEWWQRTYYRDP